MQIDIDRSEIDKNVFFLFTVKCPLVAKRIGEPVGSLVVQPARRFDKESA